MKIVILAIAWLLNSFAMHLLGENQRYIKGYSKCLEELNESEE